MARLRWLTLAGLSALLSATLLALHMPAAVLLGCMVCALVFSCTMASPATVPNVTARVMNAVRVVRPLERIKARQALLRTNMCTSPVLLSRTNQYGSTIVALRDRFLAQYCYTPQ